MEFGLMQYSNKILFLIVILLVIIYPFYLIIKALRKYTKSEPVRKQKAANAKNLGENNKLSTLALFLAGLVCGFLIFEWITPTSSLALLVSMIAVALVGIVLAVMGSLLFQQFVIAKMTAASSFKQRGNNMISKKSESNKEGRRSK